MMVMAMLIVMIVVIVIVDGDSDSDSWGAASIASAYPISSGTYFGPSGSPRRSATQSGRRVRNLVKNSGLIESEPLR